MNILLVFTDLTRMQSATRFLDTYSQNNTYRAFYKEIAPELDTEGHIANSPAEIRRLIVKQANNIQVDLIAIDVSERDFLGGSKPIRTLLHEQDAPILCFVGEVPLQRITTMIIPMGLELPSLKMIGQLKKIIQLLDLHLELLHVSNSGETMESLYDLDTDYFVDIIKRHFSKNRVSYVFKKGEDVKNMILEYVNNSEQRYLLGVPHSSKVDIGTILWGHLSTKIENQCPLPYFFLDN